MVANRLKYLRSMHNVKQADLAKILSVSQSTISGWESERYEIDNSNLCKISDYFHVSIDYLLCHTNDSPTIPTVPFDLNSILEEDPVLFKKHKLSTADKMLLKQLLHRICDSDD